MAKDATEPEPPKPVHKNDEIASQKCNKWVESGILHSKPIQFLLQTLIESGCTPPEKFIRCTNCKQPQAGGFGMLIDESTGKGVSSCNKTEQEIKEQLQNSASQNLKLLPEIFVCQQYMENETMVHRTIHHELIHAIDQCRTKMDPVNNCVHLACTEIRAENLSGECGFWKELLRMQNFGKHGQECVKRRALLSVRGNPNCAERAEDYVNAAFPRCFVDYAPYDRHPNET